MGSMSIWHWVVVAVIVAVVFGGGGKLSSLMGDAAKGVKAFKDGLKDEPDADKKPANLARSETEKEELRG